MLIVLPPSETKAVGGNGPPLDLELLSFPDLTRARKHTVAAVARLGKRPRIARQVLGLGIGQADEVARNASVRTSPTMPALERYTGVLYDALEARTLYDAERVRAYARLIIGSALFGLVRAADPIPGYRLSGATRLPDLRGGTLTKVWKPTVGTLLREACERELVVDLRSGAYQGLAPAPDAVTIRVLSERADGTRSVVSHFNKATKGRIARQLATNPSEATSLADVADQLNRAGWHVEDTSPTSLDVVVPA